MAHVALAISLLGPSLVLPFVLRARRGDLRPGAATRILLTAQGGGSVVIAIGLALSGAGLLISVGAEVLAKRWLQLALAVYAINLLVAAFISRPTLRRLLRRSINDPAGWRQETRRVRYVAYAMAVATGLIGFLMSIKPALW